MYALRTAVLAAAALLGALPALAQERESTFSPARPPALPLAVRSPYLSTWQQAGDEGGNGGYLAGEWPTFWAGQIVGWSGLVRVDNLTYTWMGAPILANNETPPVVNQTSFNYTSTRSIFTMDVGGVVNMVVTFLSPVTPTDLTRQSFPISFMDVSCSSADGKKHDVQVYTDITAEWISGDRTAMAEWNYGVITGGRAAVNQFNLAGQTEATTLEPSQATGTSITTYATNTDFSAPSTPVMHPTTPASYTSGFINPIPPPSPTRSPTTYAAFAKPSPTNVGGIAYHQVYRQTQLAFSEINQQTEYGDWYYLTDNTANLTYQSGQDARVRSAFDKNGYLRNTQNKTFRAIDDDYPVFAYAVDYGSVSTKAVSHKFAIALAQQQCVQFEGAQGNSTLNCLWTNYYDSNNDALNFYYNDYATVSTLATTLDNQIQRDSVAAGGAGYALATTLATRQAFGALEFVNNANTPLVFLKEISSDGNIQTVDVIFPFHMIALYLNPNLLRMMLDPLFINQEAGYWPHAYSIHDLGASFPNATGHNDGNDESQPLEECGDMILMTLAYAQRTGDTAYLKQHYSLLRQWNTYLVNDSLIPAAQLSTDDFAGSLVNNTNLAIKGIVGIGAMAQIANLTGHKADATNFSKTATTYVDKWQKLGINTAANPPHATLEYGNKTTWGLLYNIFPDKLLNLNLVPQKVFDIQSAYYATKFNRYGVPLQSTHAYTKSDWSLWCAAVASTAVKNQFIDTLALFIPETTTNFPLTDLFDTISAKFPLDGPMFINRPVVGGFFSLLALNGGKASSKRDADAGVEQVEAKWA